MDVSIRPAGALATVAIPTPAPAPAGDTSSTDLPPSQVVTPANAAASAQLAPQSSSYYTTTHQVILDPEAASIVYRTVDERTDKVVSQYPDDATLRRRAFFHTLDALKSAQDPVPATDRIA